MTSQPDRNGAATPDDIIAALNLQPHPEGGYFHETFRDAQTLAGSDRAVSTAIYFLLKAGQGSHWHTVDAIEMWHWYAGAPLDLGLAPPDGPARWQRLGNNILAGERPQAIVPRGHWQKARTTGEFTLVGCTVAPGFSFDGFVLAPPDWSPPGWSQQV